MKAVDFIREFGWECARKRLDKMKSERLIGSFFNDLKQYVDAWELVQAGLPELKNQMFSKDKTFDDAKEWISIVSESLLTQKGVDLKKAIQLVESVELLSHYDDDHTDHCTNIKNHVSPLTKVIEG